MSCVWPWHCEPTVIPAASAVQSTRECARCSTGLKTDLRFYRRRSSPQVKTRLESEQGISFTEFTYQLLQVRYSGCMWLELPVVVNCSDSLRLCVYSSHICNCVLYFEHPVNALLLAGLRLCSSLQGARRAGAGRLKVVVYLGGSVLL